MLHWHGKSRCDIASVYPVPFAVSSAVTAMLISWQVSTHGSEFTVGRWWSPASGAGGREDILWRNIMVDRRSVHELKPTVWVGKRGCTDVVIDEIRRQVEARGMVKVRWLRNAEVDSEYLAKSTGMEIVDFRGRTIVLSKKGTRDDRRQARNI